MDTPDSYLTSLAKVHLYVNCLDHMRNLGKLGDVTYRQLCMAEKFYPDQLLDMFEVFIRARGD
ncbi:unnamed protein product [Brassica rapa]|uniref:PRONE domain-containing protein n=1 Tax=Brassica campestris TaxID=3711 RepID=A0A3P5ZR75_BRACM|nr:unnamed protein product [Brassica rapa]CAG7881181.1 unnamed protein product [Brassica rapa]CAG7881189.1 unnamed protein product [Brassica rapa]VDC80529.1 unnamed protein product [Brassica rapa]VDC80532.1 unnamed protein product [Brassica rapa]